MAVIARLSTFESARNGRETRDSCVQRPNVTVPATNQPTWRPRLAFPTRRKALAAPSRGRLARFVLLGRTCTKGGRRTAMKGGRQTEICRGRRTGTGRGLRIGRGVGRRTGVGRT